MPASVHIVLNALAIDLPAPPLSLCKTAGPGPGGRWPPGDPSWVTDQDHEKATCPACLAVHAARKRNA